MEFSDKHESGVIHCYSDDESPEHKEELKGTIWKHDDGFFRFMPMPHVVLTCKDCRMLAEKLSVLNTSA